MCIAIHRHTYIDIDIYISIHIYREKPNVSFRKLDHICTYCIYIYIYYYYTSVWIRWEETELELKPENHMRSNKKTEHL